MQRWIIGFAFGCTLAACGPAVEVGDSDESSTGTPPGSATSDSPTTVDATDVTTGLPGPTTPTTDSPDPATSTTSGPDPVPGMLGGNYLLVVSTILVPELPFQYLTVVDPNVVGGVQQAEAYPLSLFVNSTDMPRQRLDPPIEFTIDALDNSMTFFFIAEIPGDANPISGTDVSAVLSFEGVYFPDRDFACGDVFGEASEPLAVDLTGSTFAMIPIVDGLPAPSPLGCE